VRVLLDECLPRRLKRELPGHDAKTAPAVIVLTAPSNRFHDLQPLMPRVLASIALAKRGEVLLISNEGKSTDK